MAKAAKEKPTESPFQRFAMLLRKVATTPKPDETAKGKPQKS